MTPLLPHRPPLPPSPPPARITTGLLGAGKCGSQSVLRPLLIPFLLTHSQTDDVFTHLRTHVLAYLLTHVPTYLPPPRTYGTKPSRTEATPTTSTTSRRCTSRVSAPTSASTSMAQSGPADLRCSEDRVCARLLLRGKRCASHRRSPDGAPLSYFRRTAAPSLPSTVVDAYI